MWGSAGGLSCTCSERACSNVDVFVELDWLGLDLKRLAAWCIFAIEELGENGKGLAGAVIGNGGANNASMV